MEDQGRGSRTLLHLPLPPPSRMWLVGLGKFGKIRRKNRLDARAGVQPRRNSVPSRCHPGAHEPASENGPFQLKNQRAPTNGLAALRVGLPLSLALSAVAFVESLGSRQRNRGPGDIQGHPKHRRTARDPPFWKIGPTLRKAGKGSFPLKLPFEGSHLSEGPNPTRLRPNRGQHGKPTDHFRPLLRQVSILSAVGWLQFGTYGPGRKVKEAKDKSHRILHWTQGEKECLSGILFQ